MHPRMIAARIPQTAVVAVGCWIAALALCSLPNGAAAAPPALQPGERIVFLGDSITQAGDRPGGYVTLVRERLAERFGSGEIEVIGAGISGNRVPDLEQRLRRDVLDRDPTLVVIYIGINDVWHSLSGRGTPAEQYEQGLRRIVQGIQQQGARVILATPSVIGEKHDGSNQLDEMLDRYAQISRDVAKETRAQLLDLRRDFLGELKRENAPNAEKGVLTTDGVHLNPAGNRFVAEEMLAALNAAAPAAALRHVVAFKFKPDVTDEQIDEVVEAFAALPEKIDGIRNFEWGADVSVENKAKGFTHCFVVSFDNAADRDAYLPHPAHQEFVKLVGPRLEDVFVFDYVVGR